ncbi:MAG: single-stranded-DNA-specific exonuclease RecJ [Patescibacteria group bacterium]|nr:single-stranded-DNA-specific exonuclease RecJ [Patescibacteria group bacterium]
MRKAWKIAEAVSPDYCARFPEISPVVVQLLANRGLESQEQIDEFLAPDFTRDIKDPFLFTRMRDAVERVFQAIEAREKITVWSDYDADGVTSGTIARSVIREVGAKLGYDGELVDFYIPHRDLEGYGLNQAGVERIAKEGCKLLVATDCGIGNANEIAWLRKKGIDVIVIDHHQVPDRLPDAIIIHTSTPGEIYPFKPFAAAGVAFKFACALITAGRERGIDFSPGFEKWYLDLVAIATVTDMMPLIGENRTLEKFGLVVLAKTRRPGLRKLFEAAGIASEKLDTRSIGFQIGPRLNAASRMDHANQAFALLNAEDEKQAAELATELCSLNQQRRDITKETYDQAIAQIGDPGNRKILFSRNESWPPSIVGLVAGKVCDDYYRPVILIGREGERWLGSGRSIPEFDITAALHSAEEHLARFGGHPGACGFDMKSEADIAPFIEKLTKYAEERLACVALAPAINIEAELGLDETNFDLVHALAEFAPHGMNNPKPIFLARDLTVVSFETMGMDQKHLKIAVKTPAGATKKLVGFGIAGRISELKVGAKLELAYELDINQWNGNQELQFKIIDFKL